MKTIICGGRNSHLSEDDKEYLKTLGITHVVSGGATGIDTDAIQWAKDNNIPFTEMKANWDNITHPKAVVRTRKDGKKYDVTAGFRRNEEMAKIAEACALFAGGNGTKHMAEAAKKLGLKIYMRDKQC
jgi:predicted Rossmann-fold nucleotide-binding protein